MTEITERDVINFISDRVASSEDFESWDEEVNIYIENIRDELLENPQR